MIKNRVFIDKQLIKEMSKKVLTISLIIGLVGSLGSIPPLVFYLLDMNKIYFMIIFTVLLSFGAIGLYNFFKVLQTNKRAEKANATLEYEIDEKKIIIKRSQGQDLSVNYSYIRYYNESGKYFFIHLGKNYTFPILKDENSASIEEIFKTNNIIKK